MTDTPSFKAWFGDSKVVDENGDPLVVYHGTAKDISEFTPQSDKPIKWDQFGTFFTDQPPYAHAYSKSLDMDKMELVDQGAIYPAYLSFQNPYIVEGNEGFDKVLELVKWRSRRDQSKDAFDHPEGPDMKQVRDYFKMSGYDSIIIQNFGGDSGLSNVPETQNLYIALYPSQIKSAYGNQGTFDPENPNISESW